MFKTQTTVLFMKQVRQELSKYGITLQALADDLGISHQQLSKYEIGKNRVSLDTASEICKILRIKLEI